MNKYVAATGNPWDGVNLHGPFDDFKEAMDFCEGDNKSNWDVVVVHAPDNEECEESEQNTAIAACVVLLKRSLELDFVDARVLVEDTIRRLSEQL